MTIRTAFETGCKLLEQAKIETPVLDSTVLLAEALRVSKEKLYASFTDEMEESAYGRFEKFINLRCTGMPVSYIRGRKEFFGLEFTVDKRVLVPRPDTETLVETVLNLVNNLKKERTSQVTLHDVCTGSGCIAITIKHELPFLEVSASDISAQAGEVFILNAKSILGSVLPFTLSNLLDSVPGCFDIITANPPYLTTAQTDRMKAGGWPEPGLALDGGVDGLDLIRRLLSQSWIKLNPDGVLLIEADPEQMPTICCLLEEYHFSNIKIIKDLSDNERVIQGSKEACKRK